MQDGDEVKNAQVSEARCEATRSILDRYDSRVVIETSMKQTAHQIFMKHAQADSSTGLIQVTAKRSPRRISYLALARRDKLTPRVV